MFVHYNKNENMLPIKIWQTDMEAVGEKCIEQAEHLAKLPFAHKWIALMPDTHAGKGMPIGGVIACEDVVIPNAVGVGSNTLYQKNCENAIQTLPKTIKRLCRLQ